MLFIDGHGMLAGSVPGHRLIPRLHRRRLLDRVSCPGMVGIATGNSFARAVFLDSSHADGDRQWGSAGKPLLVGDRSL